MKSQVQWEYRRSDIRMAMKIVLWMLVILVSLHSISSHGSARYLKEIVLGRCWDFQRQKTSEVTPKNCSKLWETFHNAFAFKDPCATNFSDYEPFLDEVGMDIVKRDKVRWKRDTLPNRNYENLTADLILSLTNFIRFSWMIRTSWRTVLLFT